MRIKLRTPSKKISFIAAAVIVAAAGLLLANGQNRPKVSPEPTATIHQLPVQSKPSDNIKKPSSSNGINQGTATDNRGQVPGGTSTPSSQWLVSQSGNITVKQPLSSSNLKDGSILSGSSKTSQVNYRIIDNQVGVIAQGSLSVVDGSFSGTLHFFAKSSNGRLDVFSTDPNGKEVNEVQIPVNF